VSPPATGPRREPLLRSLRCSRPAAETFQRVNAGGNWHTQERRSRPEPRRRRSSAAAADAGIGTLCQRRARPPWAPAAGRDTRNRRSPSPGPPLRSAGTMQDAAEGAGFRRRRCSTSNPRGCVGRKSGNASRPRKPRSSGGENAIARRPLPRPRRATPPLYGMAYPCSLGSDRWRPVSGTFDTTIHLQAWARAVPLMGMTTAFRDIARKYSVSVIPSRTRRTPRACRP
jgi:hypothetical protein